MAEAVRLALHNRRESYSRGKELSVTQVESIAQIAARHGFRLGGFRSFEKPVTPEQVERVAAARRAVLG